MNHARIAWIVYYIVIACLVLCTAVIIVKLTFWPACTVSDTLPPTTQVVCVDGWSVAGIAGAVLGVAATILALLGALAVAAWWTGLDQRVKEETDKLFKEQMEQFRAESIKRRDALAYLQLGDRLFSQKRMTEAITYYQKAGSLLPNDAQLQYVLGRIYSGAGDYRTAITALEASYKDLLESRSQEDTETRKEIALVLKELGLAYRRRATALNRDDDYKKALDCLELSMKYNIDSDTLCIMGGLFRRKKEYEQAYQIYKKAYIINPRSTYALANIAIHSWYHGNVEDAKEYFQQTELAAKKRLDKGEEEEYLNRFGLALAQLALGKTTEALQTFTLAINDTPVITQFDGILVH